MQLPDIEAGGRRDIIMESIKPDRWTRIFTSKRAGLVPPSDPSPRANYLITAADQSSGLIEGSLFSGHHCDEFAPPVVTGNYARFNFSNNDESPIAPYLTTDVSSGLVY